MKITLLSIGKWPKSTPYQDLFLNYQKRLQWKIDLKEIHLPHPDKKMEGQKLLNNIPNNSYIIALDERGKQLKSLELADKIKHLQNQSHSHITLIIGGADGLDQSIRDKCDMTLSLGSMTWPHMMVRVMLIEQLYRAQQILAGHPYHRE